MDKRAVGLETEFGCLVKDDSLGPPEEVVQLVKNHAFLGRGLGLLDLHARDYAFEPARSGGFLVNGGRLYVDSVGDHEEYATPECLSWEELIAHEKAGQRILVSLLDDLGLSGRVSFYNNNVDHFGGHTFGSHENYAVSLDFHFFSQAVESLLPFLVTRQIFAGSGRVGGHHINPAGVPEEHSSARYLDRDYLWIDDLYGVENDPSVGFQISQRADHIVKSVSTRVRFNRAIINPKREALASGAGFDRLHILFGESNCSEYAGWLKVAATSLVLDVIEERVAPMLARMAQPVRILRQLSRDPTWRWIVRLSDGSTIPAVDLQRLYLEAAKEYLSGRDEQTEEALREWEEVLDGLEADPLSLADRLDWAAKFKMLAEYQASAAGKGLRRRARDRIDAGSMIPTDMLYSLDMEYHNIDPAKGLYYSLEQAGKMRRKTSESAVHRAMFEPPPNTRARGRAEAVRRLMRSRSRSYTVDWDVVWLGKDACLPMPDPYDTYVDEVEEFLGKKDGWVEG
jgi:proteasome accessory factor A